MKILCASLTQFLFAGSVLALAAQNQANTNPAFAGTAKAVHATPVHAESSLTDHRSAHTPPPHLYALENSPFKGMRVVTHKQLTIENPHQSIVTLADESGDSRSILMTFSSNSTKRKEDRSAVRFGTWSLVGTGVDENYAQGMVSAHLPSGSGKPLFAIESSKKNRRTVSQ